MQHAYSCSFLLTGPFLAMKIRTGDATNLFYLSWSPFFIVSITPLLQHSHLTSPVVLLTSEEIQKVEHLLAASIGKRPLNCKLDGWTWSAYAGIILREFQRPLMEQLITLRAAKTFKNSPEFHQFSVSFWSIQCANGVSFTQSKISSAACCNH